ncbi:MAG: hypothetical protein ABIG84_06925 [archaeon]
MVINTFGNNDLEKTLKARGMYRERGLDDYNRQLGLNLVEMARQSVGRRGKFVWYDLCCGNFCARDELLVQVPDIVDRVQAHGVDLDVRKQGIEYGDAVSYKLPYQLDVVTCLQGLDYIQTYLRKGAEAVQNWYNQMDEGSILSFDVAISHVRLSGKDLPVYLKEVLGDDVVIFPTPEREKTHTTTKIYCRDHQLELPITRGLH